MTAIYTPFDTVKKNLIESAPGEKVTFHEMPGGRVGKTLHYQVKAGEQAVASLTTTHNKVRIDDAMKAQNELMAYYQERKIVRTFTPFFPMLGEPNEVSMEVLESHYRKQFEEKSAYDIAYRKGDSFDFYDRKSVTIERVVDEQTYVFTIVHMPSVKAYLKTALKVGKLTHHKQAGIEGTFGLFLD
jgi:hypothetical protein